MAGPTAGPPECDCLERQSHIQGKPAVSCPLPSTVFPCQNPLCAAPGLDGLFPLVLGWKERLKMHRWRWKSTDLKGTCPSQHWSEFLVLCFQNYFAQTYKISLNYWLYLNDQIPSPKIFLRKCHFYWPKSYELTSNLLLTGDSSWYFYELILYKLFGFESSLLFTLLYK